MRIAIGCDHGGLELKKRRVTWLQELGHYVSDFGTHTREPADYADFAEKVGLAVRSSQALRGIVICGSGVGASISANKIAGIRAGLCHDTYSARQGVEHDDMNVLVLGARVIGIETACALVDAFVAARFTGAERHRRRLAKIAALEERHSRRVTLTENEHE
jgi:RpiB/LacA/LacB family sugar-phosphate isomerase